MTRTAHTGAGAKAAASALTHTINDVLRPLSLVRDFEYFQHCSRCRWIGAYVLSSKPFARVFDD